jgi:hypothetical protein
MAQQDEIGSPGLREIEQRIEHIADDHFAPRIGQARVEPLPDAREETAGVTPAGIGRNMYRYRLEPWQNAAEHGCIVQQPAIAGAGGQGYQHPAERRHVPIV